PPLFSTQTIASISGYLIVMHIIKEVLIGYLLGFIFALIVEGAALAGQLVGTLSGFSATELLRPGSSASYPLFSRIFILLVLTLLLGCDLHHTLFRTLYESFTLLPLGSYPLGERLAENLIMGSARLFNHALLYAAIPFMILFLVIVLFAFVARLLPDFPIFWVGFPVQLIVGLGAIILAVGYYSEILQHIFTELVHLSQRILVDLQTTL
nr:hypothetical protein [Chlamydiota bacterium]